MIRISVLGTEYKIYELDRSQDDMLTNCDGYCDKTSKKIVVAKKDKDCDLENCEVYRKKVMRHEIVHAFLFESGLHENWEHQTGHDETMVDWVAAQYPKLHIAFTKAGCDD